ncbi:MAG: hypothetical protein Kow00129_06080 [Thermoleophilia bacterium]
MADKKVERNVRSSDQERPRTPAEKLTSSLSHEGTVNVDELQHDKAKAALLKKFRERDERYRQRKERSGKDEAHPPEGGET